MVTGRLGYGKGLAPPPVGLYSYELTGTDHRRERRAGQGRRRDDADERPQVLDGLRADRRRTASYTSFLVAADQAGDDPVPMTVGVAVGADSYAEPLNDFVNFPKLKSATLNIQLPAQAGGALVKSLAEPDRRCRARSTAGLLVGVVGGKGRVIKPVSARWPTGQRQVRARAAGLGARPRREVLGVRSPVLLDHGGAARAGSSTPPSTPSRFVRTLRRPSRR